MLPYLALFFLKTISCYNIDVDHPIIKTDPKGGLSGKNYFGYSVVLYRNGDNSTWVKVGAPRTRPSGAVYECPVEKECVADGNIKFATEWNSSMLGAAMDIDYKRNILAISASNWNKYDQAGSKNIHGKLIIEKIGRKVEYRNVMEEQKPQSINGTSYYSRASAGFSLQFIAENGELFVGAPGVSNYLGTAFQMKNVAKELSKWQVDVEEPRGQMFFEYSGYSVTSGYFSKRKEVKYVSGIPRSGINPTGAAFIFSFNTIYNKLLTGTQTGEYFGSALAAGDLNGDKLDDLIIGAPFRCNDPNGYNHGSIYIAFGKANLKFDTQRIDGDANGAQFGSALMVIGDVDKEGSAELAVGAPYEDQGVVYIYTYDDYSKSLKVVQRIDAGRIYEGLRGFGFSFSRAFDVDDNGFADVAVGAPASGHVVVLRSIPTVFVDAQVIIRSKLNVDSTTLSFEVRYGLKRSSNLTIIRTLEVDPEYNRFTFKKGGRQEEIQIWPNRPSEEIDLVKVNTSDINTDHEISITLTYWVKEDPRKKSSFCKYCPILSRKSVTKIEKSVEWTLKCSHGAKWEECSSNLGLDVKLRNKQYILGSKDTLNVEITFSNVGDPIFRPFVDVFLPEKVFWHGGDMICDNFNVSFVHCTSMSSLNDKDNITHTLVFSVNVEDTQPRTLLFNASSVKGNLKGISSQNLTFDVEREVDFLITGSSKELSYVYENGTTTRIQNMFKLENFGRSPSLPANISIIIPYKLKSVTFMNVTVNSPTIDNSLICDSIQDYDMTPEISPGQELNCSTTLCGVIRCSVGSLDDVDSYTEIEVVLDVDFQIVDKGTDQLVLTTMAVVDAGDFIQTGNRSDCVHISNVISMYHIKAVSLWIIIGSAIGGLVILLCITIGLTRAGFFERKERNMLVELKEKEEALEEERLLEEMIRKEFDRDPDENFGFLRQKIDEGDEEGIVELNALYGRLTIQTESSF